MVPRADDPGELLVRIDGLRHCLATAFERLELSSEDAKGLAGLLVDSELRGHPHHGVAALGVQAGFYRDGKLNPRPHVRVLHESDGATLLDGDRGCGPRAPERAMRWCSECPVSAVSDAMRSSVRGVSCRSRRPAGKRW